ncbi:MAG: peptidoglycan DD-metalloendopeptidase family protein [Candidatus Onthovivens sp.]|nr:peptidoglycan DD-metalloendopeptidase family protein [Candidatus Onthovivens sp.]
MSKKCSVLKSGLCEITQGFINGHRGLDLVGPNYTLDDIVSYANGTVNMATNGYGNGAGEGVNWAYGNFVKIINDDGTVCLYAHMEYTSVKVGQRVSKGQVIGRMGNSGNSYGGHLHWEYWTKNDYYSNIDPSPYLSPKEIVLPISVERDKNKRQFQVDYNDNLRVRTEPNLKSEVVGILNAGIYNFTEEKDSDGFKWVKIDKYWCACTDMSRILEIEKVIEDEEKEEIKEEPIINDLNTDTATKEEDSTNTLESNKQSNKHHKNDKLGIVKWLLECLINILKNIVEKM